MAHWRLWLILCMLFTSLAVQAWDDRRLGTPVVVDGRVIYHPVFALYFLPGESFDVHFKDAIAAGSLTFEGLSMPVGSQTLTAPSSPGIYPLRIENTVGQETATVNIVVMVPAGQLDSQGYLNGYRVGRYPGIPLKNNPIYLAPRGFIEVTEANRNTPVSPNFVLGQFLSKQAGGYPKYLVLRANLMLKLEQILAALNHSGKITEELVIMSGYRTPWYNRSIGNVPYSRHAWGGASDVYIDVAPRDGIMDDLNGDGRSDRHDARWLARFIDDMSRRGEFGERMGGLGVYGTNSAHGPFVHIDVRGSRARW